MTADYSEPSQSTVVLPEPPSWLNLDGIMPYDDRERIKDVIEAGRELLPGIAEWARWAQATIDALPDGVWESREVQECLGVRALNEVMLLIGAIGGNPSGTVTNEFRAVLIERYPQYADMLRDRA